MTTDIYFKSCDIDTVKPVSASGLPRQSTFPLDYSTLKRSRSFGNRRRQPPKSQVSLTLSHWDSVEQTIKFGEFEFQVNLAVISTGAALMTV